MKKIIILIAFVSVSKISLGQATNNSVIPPEPIRQSKFTVGVKGAYGHSFLMPYGNNTFMPSWDAGISTIFSPFEHLGFGFDGTYSTEGVKFETPEYVSETKLNYVRLEPMKVIYFFRGYEKDFRPKISIAPDLGFLVNGNDNPAYNTFDIGAKGSLGFNYRLLRAVWLNVDGTYYQGLRDVYNGNTENDLNGNARLNVGLSFGF